MKLVITHYSGVDSADKIIESIESSGFAGEIVVAKDLDSFEV